MFLDIYLLVAFILTSSIMLLMPFVLSRSIPFGVRIPMAFSHSSEVKAEFKKYLIIMGVYEAVLLLASYLVSLYSRWEFQSILFFGALILGNWTIYYLSHRHLIQVKRDQKWMEDKRQVIIASATPRGRKPTTAIHVGIIISGLIVMATAFIGLINQHNLPGLLIYDFPGNLVHSPLKLNLTSILYPVFVQIGISAVVIFLAWLRIFGNQPLDAEDPQGSANYQNVNLNLSQFLFVILAVGIDLAILIAAINAWQLLTIPAQLTQFVILIPVLGWMIFTPVLLINANKRRATEQKSTYVTKEDDDEWKLGLFYFNPQNPAIMVQKRFGIGRTLNFGNPLSWVILLAIIGFIIYSAAIN